ncbi:alpha/beta hydrolase family protein [Lysobacter terrae]
MRNFSKCAYAMIVLTSLVALSSCNASRSNASTATASRATKQSPSLAEERKSFATRLVADTLEAAGPADVPPKEVFNVVHYPSPVGELVAYVSPDPGDGKRHPAVIWAHGGYGGIGSFLWEEQSADNDQSTNAFRNAGIVVMTPSWRQENDNPGRFEMFYGEVDDLHAARDYLAKLPYVDPERIYVAGHSTGGTMTLLASELKGGFRAAFSLGGIPDLKIRLEAGKTSTDPPFDLNNPEEYRLRSPMHFVGSMRSPTFYFEGSNDYWDEFDRVQEEANEKGAQFHAFRIEGGNHFSIVAPVTQLIAKKILEDTGPKADIHFADDEIAALTGQLQ